MFEIRLPINLCKIVYGLAVLTEGGSWAAKQTAWMVEKTAQVAEYAVHGAKVGAEKVKNGNEWLEQKARETKQQAQQAIREGEFQQINQEISQGSEKFNPQLTEITDTEFADWVVLEKASE